MEVSILGAYLEGHPSSGVRQFLLDGFTFRFHTGLITLPTETFECRNLLSADHHASLVDDLLAIEVNKGFVIGPFKSSPFGMWRVSPIGVVCGKFSHNHCLIYDLSTPHFLHVPSLNLLIPSEEFSLKYSSVESAIQLIHQLGKGHHVLLAQVDLVRFDL